jgi:eukaryotic-like serine/threonine-protein kinase
MDENQFLENYKKKLNPENAEKPDADQSADKPRPQALRYEEKSDFRQLEPAPPHDAGQTAPRRKWPFVTLAVFLVLLALFLVWFFNRGVDVIDLTDWTLKDAQLWAGDHDIRLQVTEVYNDEYEAERIFDQDPSPGSRLEKGGFLKVTVSLGHDMSVMLPLPDLMSMSVSEVEKWAETNFMTKVRITTEYHDTVEAGQVIEYTINDDTVIDQVRRDTPIYVIVSKGPEPHEKEQVTVPDFYGLPLAQAKQTAKDNDLVLKIIEQYDDWASNGTVMDQDIPAEEEVDAGSEITLTVSKGKKILVPNFADYTRQQAQSVAAELGITVTMTERYSSRSADQFLSQNIEVGSIYHPGDILELVYSLGNKILLPSFIGQSRSAIESWAQEHNAHGASIRISATQTQSNTPKDTVIYQDKTNKMVSPGTTVYITVSLGKIIFMPDLVAPEGSDYSEAMTRDKALSICEELGLVPIFVSAENEDRLPGEIWKQSVHPGDEVYEQSTVTLTYNPAEETMAVPDFTGMTQEEIIENEYLKQLNITFEWADLHVEGFDNTVFMQSLPAGQTVALGSAITLTISPELPAEPTPAPSDTTEPSLSPTPEPTPTDAELTG